MDRVTLPFDDWPQADQDAWATATCDGDIFADRGPAAHWRPATRRHARNGHARWLFWLTQDDPRALALTPADRVTIERLRRYLADLQGRMSASGAWNEIKGLYDAMRVMAPGHDWAWLRRLKADLESRVEPRDCRERIISPARMSALGFSLMDSADLASDKKKAAIVYRDGLLIAMLACRPVRRCNLAAMRIGKHLVRRGNGFLIVFESSETKTGEPFELPLPHDLCAPMAHYLDDIRLGFPAAETHDGLWASSRGGPMSDTGLYDQVCSRTEAVFGVRVNLHQFRHNLATFVALEHPDQAVIAAGILGHRDYRSTESHYNKAGSVRAGNTHQQRLEARRKVLAAKRKKRT